MSKELAMRSRKSINKSDPILMAAKDAFIERGFAATSMDDVAARAGTTKRTVYNNFGSKERLLDAVIDHALTLFEASAPPLDPGADTIQITQFCEVALQLTTWRAAIGLQRMLVTEGPNFPHLAERLSRRTSAALSEPLSRLLETRGSDETAAKQHAIRAIDLLTSKARLDRLVGLRRPYPLPPGKNALDEADRRAVELAVQYLCGGRIGA
jgi:AcrR family transcriptional regulator